MTGTAHASPEKHRDHLWVLVIIAACCLLEVWASWVTIGSESGFPKIGGPHGLSTDWTLAVTTEAYWGYALYSWLAASPGPRSRRFAMWSAGGVFILSLTGQGAAHLVKPGAQPPAALVLFVTALPVIVLAAIAILVHFRQADREAAAEAAAGRAENDERTGLRAQLAAERQARGADVGALEERLAGESAAREAAEGDAALRAGAEAAREELAAALQAAREGRDTDVRVLRRQLDDERAGREAAEQEAAARVEAGRERDEAVAEARSARAAEETANAARAAAEEAAGKAAAKVEWITRKNDRKTGGPAAREKVAAADAYKIIAAAPRATGAGLARKHGMSERWWQDRRKEWTGRTADGTGTDGG